MSISVNMLNEDEVVNRILLSMHIPSVFASHVLLMGTHWNTVAKKTAISIPMLAVFAQMMKRLTPGF